MYKFANLHLYSEYGYICASTSYGFCDNVNPVVLRRKLIMLPVVQNVFNCFTRQFGERLFPEVQIIDTLIVKIKNN